MYINNIIIIIIYQDLKEAYRLNPKDSQIYNKYHSVMTNYNKQKKKDKEQFSGLFKRGKIVNGIYI